MSGPGEGPGPDDAGRSDARAGRGRPGRRALFSDPATATRTGPDEPDLSAAAARPPRAGRRALFSDPPGLSDRPGHSDRPGLSGRPGTHGGPDRTGRGPVVVCRTCLARTPLTLSGLGRALIPSLWLPTRPWPRLMRCPACHRVSWCRLEWSAPRATGVSED